jgi:hypothetical protein
MASVQIAPQLAGTVTERDLLQPEGTLKFALGVADIVAAGGYLFQVGGDTFEFSLHIGGGVITLRRNGHEARLAINRADPSPKRLVFAVWAPSRLEVYCGSAGSNKQPDRVAVDTPPIQPPASHKEKAMIDKVVKIVQSPFTPAVETAGNAILKLHVPYSDTMVTIQVNPSYDSYQDDASQPGIEVRQVTVTSSTDETRTLTFDLFGARTHEVTVGGSTYKITLQNIIDEVMQGQKFRAYEFRVQSAS